MGTPCQNAKTFVSEHWTLEYDLVRSGLSSMLLSAALLANSHDKICDGTTTKDEVLAKAKEYFRELLAKCDNDGELVSIHIYELFTSKKASKVITAQYLAEAIEVEAEHKGFDSAVFEGHLPTYLVDAIKHACGHPPSLDPPAGAQPVATAVAQ